MYDGKNSRNRNVNSSVETVGGTDGGMVWVVVVVGEGNGSQSACGDLYTLWLC